MKSKIDNRTAFQKIHDWLLFTKEYRKQNQEYINKLRKAPFKYGMTI